MNKKIALIFTLHNGNDTLGYLYPASKCVVPVQVAIQRPICRENFSTDSWGFKLMVDEVRNSNYNGIIKYMYD